jgi:hypothetical protein
VEVPAPADITELRHVRPAAEKRAAEEIANRQKCEDFDAFKPLFEQVQNELGKGLRQTRRFERKSEIAPGRSDILGGQKAYIVATEEPFTNEHGNIDARLRVVFDNGTESNLLMRSLQKALQQAPAGRRIMELSAGPLFADRNEEGYEASGIVYVLRSKSDHPVIAAHRDVLHKIGVTGGDVVRRIANARLDPTFLMADAEIVATYELFNINRPRLENLIHRIFGAARLDIQIKDRFGQPVIPREWFLVPLFLGATDLDPPHEKQDDDHDQDDAEDADAAMAIAVAVAAEAATEPADEHDHEYDEEDKSERHRAFLSEVRFSRYCKNLTRLSAAGSAVDFGLLTELQ